VHAARWRSILRDRTARFVAVLLLAQLVGLYAMQLQHATGWGNINLRYFLPGLAVFGIALALGALRWSVLRGQLVVAIMAVFAAGAVLDVIWFSAPKINSIPVGNALDYFPQSVMGNGLPVAIPFVLIGCMVIGLCAVSAAFLTLTRSTKSDELSASATAEVAS
jgi:hypothetical protein